MSKQTVPRETSSASLRHSRAAEGVGGEEEGGSSSKIHQQPFSSSSRGGGLVGQQQGPSSTSSSSSGQQSSSTEFGDAAQYQELNPIGEGNLNLNAKSNSRYLVPVSLTLSQGQEYQVVMHQMYEGNK